MDFKWIQALINEGDALSWAIVLVLALVGTVLIKGALRLLVGRLKKITAKTATNVDDLLVDLLAATKIWFLFVWVVYFSIPGLEPSERVANGFQIVVVIVTAIQVALWGLYAIGHWRRVHFEAKADADATSLAAIGLIATAIQGLFVIVIVLLALSNLGVDIAALIAGLGVGGIAVALAAQNVLGDLFASISIILDKPFVLGDFIIVGEMVGNVEYIGLRTTRVRSLSGEQLIFSNKDLLESRIQNFKSMWQRRVVLKFGIVYSTDAAKLELIPKWIKSFIDEDQDLRFDRCHFAGYGDSSLDFECVFFVTGPEFNLFMGRKEQLLLKMFRKFKQEEVEFAFPTQTLHVETFPDRANSPSSEPIAKPVIT